jgi:hypothetical protein
LTESRTARVTREEPETRSVVWLGQKPLTNRFGEMVQFGQKVELTLSQITAFKDQLGDQGDPRTIAALAAASSGAAAQTVHAEAHGDALARKGPETIRVAGIEPTGEDRPEELSTYQHIKPEDLAVPSGPDLREQQGQEGGEPGAQHLKVEGKPGEFAKEALQGLEEASKKMQGEPSSQPRQEQSVVTGAVGSAAGRTAADQPSPSDHPAQDRSQPKAEGSPAKPASPSRKE